MNENRLFVGNLSYQTMENDLQDYFSQAGAVTSVNLMLDKVTGRSRGFAFVEFATSEEANKAVEKFHNQEFQGRHLDGQRRPAADGARAPLGRRRGPRKQVESAAASPGFISPGEAIPRGSSAAPMRAIGPGRR